MCAGSNTKLRGEEVGIYMGYFGGHISIGDLHYYAEINENKSKSCSKGEFINKLKTYTKDEIANMILDLVENSEEQENINGKE